MSRHEDGPTVFRVQQQFSVLENPANAEQVRSLSRYLSGMAKVCDLLGLEFSFKPLDGYIVEFSHESLRLFEIFALGLESIQHSLMHDENYVIDMKELGHLAASLFFPDSKPDANEAVQTQHVPANPNPLRPDERNRKCGYTVKPHTRASGEPGSRAGQPFKTIKAIFDETADTGHFNLGDFEHSFHYLSQNSFYSSFRAYGGRPTAKLRYAGAFFRHSVEDKNLLVWIRNPYTIERITPVFPVRDYPDYFDFHPDREPADFLVEEDETEEEEGVGEHDEENESGGEEE